MSGIANSAQQQAEANSAQRKGDDIETRRKWGSAEFVIPPSA